MTTTGAVALVDTTAHLRAARSRMAGRVAVVMTMGALHAGHADLLRAARADADHVIATIFVNPLQFGPTEDLDRYPRSLEHDLEVCRVEGVDLVFAPPAQQLYPSGPPQVRVEPGPLATILEGAARPGHFEGVLTVVLKLLHLSQPTAAYFGEKDYQQLTLIRHMVADLDVGVRIVAVPTRREPDGLALSSRNRYLTPAQRTAALRLSAALRAGQAAAAAGADAAGVRRAGWAVLTPPDASTEDAAELVPDYLELTDPDLGPPPRSGSARLLVAAWVGTTRLIDNTAVELLC